MSMLSSEEAYRAGFEACMNVYTNKVCRTCFYAKTSGDFYICDLGIRMDKVWGNSPIFGCTKHKRREDGTESKTSRE